MPASSFCTSDERGRAAEPERVLRADVSGPVEVAETAPVSSKQNLTTLSPRISKHGGAVSPSDFVSFVDHHSRLSHVTAACKGLCDPYCEGS